MKYLKFFENLSDHPLLDFFQDIRDEYDVKSEENHYRIFVDIDNISKVSNTNPDIKQIVSILHSLNNSVSKMGKLKTNSYDTCDAFYDIFLNHFNHRMKSISLIQRIEDMTEYKFHRCSEIGFLDHHKSTFKLSLSFTLND